MTEHPFYRLFVTTVVAVTSLSLRAPRADGAVNRVWIRGAGTSNWALGTNWSPTGAPQLGDGVFVTATDSFVKTVVLDGASFAVTNNYQQVWVDESGPGQISLLQVDLQLLAVNLNVAVSGPGFYNLSGGTGVFGNATLGMGNGAITVGPSGTLTPTIFRQLGSSLTNNGRMNCNTFIMTGGSFTNTGTYSGFNFTQSGAPIFTSQMLNLTGTYTYNGGVFTTAGGGHGGVNCGTFIDNVGTFEGIVDTSHLIVNGSGTFLNGVTNRGPLIVPAAQTIWAEKYFDQIGGSVVQSGNVGGDVPGGLHSTTTFVTIGGGATWTHLNGRLSGSNMAVGVGLTGPGTYIMNGDGSAVFSGFGVGAESDGTVLHSAGFVKANSVVLGGYAGIGRGLTIINGQRGVYNLGGGSIQANQLLVAPTDSISGTFIQTGGQALFGRFLANTDNTSTAVVNIQGGSFVVDEESINGGSFTQTGGFVYVGDNLNGFGDVTVTGSGSFITRRLRQDSLSLGGNGELAIGGLGLSTSVFASTTSRVKSLNFGQVGNTLQGRLNIGVSDLVVDYDSASPAASIRLALASGHANGAWTGPGIMSGAAAGIAAHNTALGWAESSSIFGAAGGIFSGLAVDNTALLIKYTYYGDSDLDGDVDIADLGAIASNWQSAGDWRRGDFDYNGVVNVGDLGLLAGNWQAGVGNPLGPSLQESLASLGLPAASVPEPTAAAWLACAALLLRRRAKLSRV